MSTHASHTVNRWVKWLPFAVILLAAGLLLSYVVIAPPSINWGASNVDAVSSLQRVHEADAARYTAMAEYYSALQDPFVRVHEADAARYTAMAEYYSAWREELNRIHEADAARYTAMAKYYSEK
jgi:hypothetical protein